ncbi:MAG: protein translocase subunit SecF [Chloroflexi bacterium]|nr:protein translocase subunit SecF [Chloroflexota bacterium]
MFDIFHIVQQRRWYYRFSALLILPGLISILATLILTGSPLFFSVDFTGGTLWEVRFSRPIAPGDVVRIFNENGITDVSVNTVGDDRTLDIRTAQITPEEKAALLAAMTEAFGEAPEELVFRSVGPSIGHEVTRTAIIAVTLASLVILGFITWAFRNVEHPVRFGSAAILAMLHDILITMGFYSIMGWIAGWQVDALFLTALLTIIGFSVQDTIVVFDRIRENSRRRRGEDFDTIANRSLLETMQRSIATQINAMFVMIALLLFGGITIRPFIATMFVGLLSGTYSSLFIATPLLSSWHHDEMNPLKRFRRPRKQSATA